MTFAEFHNGLRLLNSLDLHELQDQGMFTHAGDKRSVMAEWESFRNHPWHYLIRCSDREAAAIWRAMEKRTPPRQVVVSTTDIDNDGNHIERLIPAHLAEG